MPIFTSAAREQLEQATSRTGSGGYLNPKDIPTDSEGVRITILGCDGEESNSLTFYEIWGEVLGEKGPNGPVRKSLRFAKEPSAAEVNEHLEENGMVRGTSKFGKVDEVRFGMAFWVWNYAEEAIQVLMFTQKPLVEGFQEAFQDEEVATSPSKWDLSLKKVEKAKFVDYSVSLRPGKRADKALNARISLEFNELLEKGADLSRLLVGGNPFQDDTPPF